MNLVNWGVWSKRCTWSLFMEGHFVRSKVVCATVWSVCLFVGNICVGQKTCVGVCGVWGGGRTRWSPHDSQLALGVPPLTMPHKGDLKLPPVTQGDVTTNKINATRTDSNKCHLNGVSNISVWIFAQKRLFFCSTVPTTRLNFWNLCKLSQEVWWRDPGLLKTDGRFSGGPIQLALVSDSGFSDFPFH